MFTHSLIITPHYAADFGAGVMNKRNTKLITACSLRQTIYEVLQDNDNKYRHKLSKYFDSVQAARKNKDSLLIDEIIKKKSGYRFRLY